MKLLPRAVVWIGLVSFFTDVSADMIFPLLPALMLSIGASGKALGLVEGAAEATASLLKIVSGRISDRVSRRKPLTLFGYSISSLVRPLMAFAVTPAYILCVRVVDRVGKGLRSSPRDAMLADMVAPSERGRAFGFHRAMDNLGAVVGPLIATALLASGVALRTVFLASIVPGSLALIVLWRGVKERAHEPGLATPLPSTLQTQKAGPLPKILRRYLFVVAVFSIGNAADAFLLLRAHKLGMATALVPIAWTLHNLVRALFSTVGGILSDRFGRRPLLIAGWMVYAVAYAGFGYASEVWHIWVLLVVYGLHYSLVEGTEKAMVGDLAPAAERGRAFGWFNGIVGLAALPASLGFGALADRFGFALPFTIAAGLAVLASGLLLLLVPRPVAHAT